MAIPQFFTIKATYCTCCTRQKTRNLKLINSLLFPYVIVLIVYDRYYQICAIKKQGQSPRRKKHKQNILCLLHFYTFIRTQRSRDRYSYLQNNDFDLRSTGSATTNPSLALPLQYTRVRLNIWTQFTIPPKLLANTKKPPNTVNPLTKKDDQPTNEVKKSRRARDG